MSSIEWLVRFTWIDDVDEIISYIHDKGVSYLLLTSNVLQIWYQPFGYKSARYPHRTQFSNDSNYSKFNEENIATNCFMATVLN